VRKFPSMLRIIAVWGLISTFLVTYAVPASLAVTLVTIDEFKGLDRNESADKIDTGAHSVFKNVYINERKIQVVKGRDQTGSTTSSTVNLLFYYENDAGTVQKLVVAEPTNLVTYTVAGASRTVIASSLTNEKWDATQIGDTLYLTSSTNGLFKWTGSGSATALGSVSAPSSVTFSTSSNAGGLTPGLNAVITNVGKEGASSGFNSYLLNDGTCVVASGNDILTDEDLLKQSNVSSGSLDSTYWAVASATNSVYKYKIVKYNFRVGIESEPSAVTTVSLSGKNTVSWGCSTVVRLFTSVNCTSPSVFSDCAQGGVQDSTVVLSGEKTATTGTLASAPSAPFNTFRVYRSVASGSDFFLVGEQDTGTFTDGRPDIALSTPLDTTVDTISPPSLQFAEEYKGVLFVGEGEKLRFTRIPVQAETDADTYWLETDQINVGTVGITALQKTSNSLLIFTKDKIMELTGFGVTSFRLRTLIEGIGTISNETVESDTDGNIFFFSGAAGVYKLNVGRQRVDTLTGTLIPGSAALLQRISSPNMDDVFLAEDAEIVLAASEYEDAHAYYDLDNDFYFLYIGDDSLLYDNKLGNWTHIPSTDMEASVYKQAVNSLGTGILQSTTAFFDNWTGYENAGSAIEVEILTKQYSFTKPPNEVALQSFWIVHEKSAATQTMTVDQRVDKSTSGLASPDTVDLTTNFVDKFSQADRGFWMQWRLTTSVNQTSNTIVPPVNIINYSFTGTEEDPD